MTAFRALVFGGSGFIGGNLLAELHNRGCAVFAAASPSRQQHLRLDPELATVVDAEHDVAGIRDAIRISKPDVIFNLVASGTDHTGRGLEALVVGNVGFVAALMEASAEMPAAKVIHTGSWSEYADPTGTAPITEDHPLAPSSPYGAAKAGTTLLGAALGRKFGVPFIALRLFNVYGPGEAAHRLLPFLVGRLISGDGADLTPGHQVRDFVYVGDAVEALISAADHLEVSGTFNVATEVGTSVRDFAGLAALALGAPAELLRFGALPGRPDEPSHVVGDATRFRGATRWSAVTPVGDGVARTVKALLGKAVG